MSTEQTPEELGYTRPARPERLSRDEVLVLQAFERGEFPNTHRHASKMALAAVRRWGLVHHNSNALTPAGVEALAKSRAAK